MSKRKVPERMQTVEIFGALVAAVLLFSGLAAAPSLAATRVGQWDRFEASVTNAKRYSDPYKDVTLSVTYTRPDNRKIDFWGFYDGGTTWKIRFLPDQIGAWRYKATFSDGAPGISGTFTCVASTIPGMISKDEVNPRLSIASHYLNRNAPGRGAGWSTPKLWPLSAAEYQRMEAILNDLADRRLLVYPFAGFFGRDADRPESAADQDRFIRYTLARLGPYWNVLLSVGGPEPRLRGRPYLSVEEIHRLGTEIRKRDVFGHPLSVHNATGDDPFQDAPWLSYGTLQGPKTTSLATLSSGLLKNHHPEKPLYAQETLWSGNKNHPDYTDTQLRKNAYVITLSAAALNFADNDPDLSDGAGGNSSEGFSGTLDPADRLQGRHDIVKRVWDFFETVPFYRLSQEAAFPAQIQDCKAAIRWLRAHAKEYNLDPERFGAWGSSAGGHLVALLGTAGHVKEWETAGAHQDVSSRVQAVCDWFGPSDFTRMADAPGAARANPITYIAKDTPPFLILHGDKDMTVPMNQSELLYAALKKAGVEATFHIVEGAGHGFPGPEPLQMVARFFDRRLKAEPAAAAGASPLVFVGDFETGDLSGWRREAGREDSVTVVSAPVRAGKHAVRFDLRKDDPLTANSKRAELKLSPEPAGVERWYGFSIYLSEDWVADDSPEIVAQWHEVPDWHLGEDWRSPPLALTVRGDRWTIHRIWDPNPLTLKNKPGRGGGSETLDLGPYRKGVWTDWVLHVKWSYQEDGLLEVWKDGRKLVTHKGPNTYNDRLGNYFKIGVYKWDWKNRPETSKAGHRVLYHDEVRIADERARFEDVAPRGDKMPGPRKPA